MSMFAACRTTQHRHAPSRYGSCSVEEERRRRRIAAARAELLGSASEGGVSSGGQHHTTTNNNYSRGEGGQEPPRVLPPLLSPERGGLNEFTKVLLTAPPPPVPPPPPRQKPPPPPPQTSRLPAPHSFNTVTTSSGAGMAFLAGAGGGLTARPRSPFSRPKGSAQSQTNRKLLHQLPAHQCFPTNEPPPPVPDKYVNQLHQRVATGGTSRLQSDKNEKSKMDHGEGGDEGDALPVLPVHRGLPVALLQRRHMTPAQRMAKPLVPPQPSSSSEVPALPSLVPTTTAATTPTVSGRLPPMLSPHQAVGVAGVVEVLQRLDRGQRQALREQRRREHDIEAQALMDREGLGEYDTNFESPLFGAPGEDPYVRLPWMVPRASSAASSVAGGGGGGPRGLAGVDGGTAMSPRPVSIIRNHSQFSASASMVATPTTNDTNNKKDNHKNKSSKEGSTASSPSSGRFLKKGAGTNRRDSKKNAKNKQVLSISAVNALSAQFSSDIREDCAQSSASQQQRYPLEFSASVASPGPSQPNSPSRKLMADQDSIAGGFSSTAVPAAAAARRGGGGGSAGPSSSYAAAAGGSTSSLQQYYAPYDEEKRLREFLKNGNGQYEFYDDTDLSDTLRKQRKRIPPLRYYLPSRVLSTRPRDPATGLFLATPPISPHRQTAGLSSAGVSATTSMASRSPEVSPRRRGPGGAGAAAARSSPEAPRVSSPRFQRMSSLLGRHRTRVSHRGIYHLDKKLEEWRRPEEVARREWFTKKVRHEPLQLRDAHGSPTEEMGKYERMIFEEQEERLMIVKEQVRIYWTMVCEWRIEKEYVPKLVSWI